MATLTKARYEEFAKLGLVRALAEGQLQRTNSTLTEEWYDVVSIDFDVPARFYRVKPLEVNTARQKLELDLEDIHKLLASYYQNGNLHGYVLVACGPKQADDTYSICMNSEATSEAKLTLHHALACDYFPRFIRSCSIVDQLAFQQACKSSMLSNISETLNA